MIKDAQKASFFYAYDLSDIILFHDFIKSILILNFSHLFSTAFFMLFKTK
jgi:hypothetical protein